MAWLQNLGPPRLEESPTCTWKYDDDHDYWETDCGEIFQLFSGTPAENGMRFCLYCGRRLTCAAPREGVRNENHGND